jgi:hypothetical protein
MQLGEIDQAKDKAAAEMQIADNIAALDEFAKKDAACFHIYAGLGEILDHDKVKDPKERADSLDAVIQKFASQKLVEDPKPDQDPDLFKQQDIDKVTKSLDELAQDEKLKKHFEPQYQQFLKDISKGVEDALDESKDKKPEQEKSLGEKSKEDEETKAKYALAAKAVSKVGQIAIVAALAATPGGIIAAVLVGAAIMAWNAKTSKKNKAKTSAQQAEEQEQDPLKGMLEQLSKGNDPAKRALESSKNPTQPQEQEEEERPRLAITKTKRLARPARLQLHFTPRPANVLYAPWAATKTMSHEARPNI